MCAIKNMASQGRCPIYLKQGTCYPWNLADRWDVPDHDKYMATIEVEYLGFIAGIVVASEVVLGQSIGDCQEIGWRGRSLGTSR